MCVALSAVDGGGGLGVVAVGDDRREAAGLGHVVDVDGGLVGVIRLQQGCPRGCRAPGSYPGIVLKMYNTDKPSIDINNVPKLCCPTEIITNINDVHTAPPPSTTCMQHHHHQRRACSATTINDVHTAPLLFSADRGCPLTVWCSVGTGKGADAAGSSQLSSWWWLLCVCGY